MIHLDPLFPVSSCGSFFWFLAFWRLYQPLMTHSMCFPVSPSACNMRQNFHFVTIDSMMKMADRRKEHFYCTKDIKSQFHLLVRLLIACWSLLYLLSYIVQIHLLLNLAWYERLIILDGALHVLKSWLRWLWLQLYHCWGRRGTGCEVSVHSCEGLPIELREKVISLRHR
jgi:hypothetical protein